MMKAPLQRCLLRPLAVQRRFFHSTRRRDVVKPFLLADIGEGIRECQIIQWFVQPGARVEQFDKLCEVQSDKAAVEITSPFDGVVKELHYEPDDMAIVGKPLMDIDIQGEISPEDEAKLADSANENNNAASEETTDHTQSSEVQQTGQAEQASGSASEREVIGGPLGRKDSNPPDEKQPPRPPPNSKHQTLATPAVRHLTKEHNISIADIHGTGKDGRILKEDVHRHMSESAQQVHAPTQAHTQQSQQPSSQTSPSPVPLTPVQAAMFRTMTASLSIPHFLYTTPLNLTPLTQLRQRLNSSSSSSSSSSFSSSVRLTPLPFILKAVSKAFTTHPLLNASLNTPTTTTTSSSSSSSSSQKPSLQHNPSHNIGIAVSTPVGLLVPVIRDVQAKSISEIASEISFLATKAREGKLEAREMQGASFTVSNIGAIGRGSVVAPVIVGPQVGILGVGRSRVVPVWVEGKEGGGSGGGERGGYWGKQEEVVMSWCADHRVVDGAECAQVAELVNRLLENVEGWVVDMR